MLLSKRERFFHTLERLPGICCPVCSGEFHRTGDDLCCNDGHLLNVNRKGCINVLKKQYAGCYDAALFEARKRVLAAGCYEPVAAAIDRMLPNGPLCLLDAGCGEGWYLNRLLRNREDRTGIGVDISREAILQATDHDCTALWCVGDLRHLPLKTGCVTAILDILTPASYDEFRRVLSPEGVLIKVYPGSGYLREIRESRSMALYAEGQVDAYLRDRVTILRTERVTSVIPVDPSLWRDFVWMTPLNQDMSNIDREELASHPAKTVTIDLHIGCVSMQDAGKVQSDTLYE